MKLEAWRILKAGLKGEAFTGFGARRYGGRWNSPGLAVVYTSEHASLAVLEILVHLGSSGPLPAYLLYRCAFDAGLRQRIEVSDLPRDWRTSPPPAALRRIGDEWIRSGRSAVLEVPSAVLPVETNYLLNPAHPDFKRIHLEAPQPLRLDARLRPGSG